MEQKMTRLSVCKAPVLFLACLVSLPVLGGEARGVTVGTVPGGSVPDPSDSAPTVGEEYTVDLVIVNNSFSKVGCPGDLVQCGKGIQVDVEPASGSLSFSAQVILACTDGTCATQEPGTVLFESCTPHSTANCTVTCNPVGSPVNAVQLNVSGTGCTVPAGGMCTTNGCTNPAGGTFNVATVKVKQVQPASAGAGVPPAPSLQFVMQGAANMRGTVGTCSAGTCSNTAAGYTCASNTDCNFSNLNAEPVFSSTSLFATSCFAAVDKEVSCDGGATFHDVGLVTADEDGHGDVCLSWNGHDTVPAESVKVRYRVAELGGADLQSCTVTEGNNGFPTTVTVGGVSGTACTTDADCANVSSVGTVACEMDMGVCATLGGFCNATTRCGNGPGGGRDPAGGGCVAALAVNSAMCTTALSAAEPDTATVNCQCITNATPPVGIPTSAFDEANFMCETPGLNVIKTCPP